MSNRDLRGETPPEQKPTVTEREVAERMTIHAARVVLFDCAMSCEAQARELAQTAEELLPKVRPAGDKPMLLELAIVAHAAKELICRKLADLGLLDSVPAPNPENDNGPSTGINVLDGPKDSPRLVK